MMQARIHAAINPSRAKFKELLLYVAERSESDLLFGATKLNKILFYSDFYSFLLRGKPITGVRYQHLKQGPAPRMLLPVKRELVAGRRASEATRMTPRGVQKRLVALDSPDLRRFDAQDIAIVDRVIDWLRDKTAEEVSDLSHLEAGWRMTHVGEDIPYETAILETRRPAKSDLAWARSMDDAR